MMLKSAVENQREMQETIDDSFGVLDPFDGEEWDILVEYNQAAQHALALLNEVTYPYVSAAELLLVSNHQFSIDLESIMGNLPPV